jgi:hypothetical protein
MSEAENWTQLAQVSVQQQAFATAKLEISPVQQTTGNILTS